MTDSTSGRAVSQRSPYIAVPRDLDSHDAWTSLSLHAQWLLQHLERDPYRLKCGVFVLNERLIARAAKATTADVGEWFAELVGAGWAIEDEATGEVWLTMHMAWDNTLNNRNHAVAVVRDVKRVKSEHLSRLILAEVYRAQPALDPGEIDPGRDEAHSEATANATPNAIAEGVEMAPRIHGALSTEHDPRSTTHDPPSTAPEARDTAHQAPSTGGAQCENCDDLGIYTDERGSSKPCTCATARKVADDLNRNLRSVS